MRAPLELKYALTYAGMPAGEQTLTLERKGRGLRMRLLADVRLPLPRTRQEWISEMDASGLPLRYSERVEGRETRVFDLEFLRSEGVVVGKDVVLPYIVDYHDPLSLILALSHFQGEARTLHLVGGRVHATVVGEETLNFPWGPIHTRVIRLRPGLSLIYYDSEGRPVRFVQQLGQHYFEANLTEAYEGTSKPSERPNTKKRQRRKKATQRRRAISR